MNQDIEFLNPNTIELLSDTKLEHLSIAEILDRYGDSLTEKNFLELAMVVLDGYLNAGSKEARKVAATSAKLLYKKYYGVDYVNRIDRPKK